VRLEVPVARPSAVLPEAIPLEVAFEDADLLVVNKPRGMVVHPGAGVSTGTLVNALLHHCAGGLSGIGGEARPGIVHRIDKDTTGLLVVAKHDRAHQGLAAQFAEHSVHRRYRALAWGTPDSASARLMAVEGVSREAGGVLKVDAPLGRHPKDRLRMAVRWREGRRAVTRARVLNAFGPASEMELWLETGRTHQVRVHFAHLGHPLIGDPVYGQRRVLPKDAPQEVQVAIDGFKGQALHAAELGFVHPAQNSRLHFEIEPPDDYLRLRGALGKLGML